MTNQQNGFLAVSKFAAIIFLANEHYQYSKPLLLRIKEEESEQALKSAETTLNRSQKKKLEKMLAEDMEKYKKRINSIGNLLNNLSVEFQDSSSEAHRKMHDFSVDLLQRTLDKFTVVEGDEILEDKVKDHIFDSLDKIPVKKRNEEETQKLIWAFDNFIERLK
jgi:hypothetical protein